MPDDRQSDSRTMPTTFDNKVTLDLSASDRAEIAELVFPRGYRPGGRELTYADLTPAEVRAATAAWYEKRRAAREVAAKEASADAVRAERQTAAEGVAEMITTTIAEWFKEASMPLRDKQSDLALRLDMAVRERSELEARVVALERKRGKDG